MRRNGVSLTLIFGATGLGAAGLGATDPLVLFWAAGFLILSFNLEFAEPFSFTGFAAALTALAGFAGFAAFLAGFVALAGAFTLVAGFAAFFAAFAGAAFFDLAAGFAGLALAIKCGEIVGFSRFGKI